MYIDNPIEKLFGTYSREEDFYFEKEVLPYAKNKDLNILEIGFGSGNFLSWAKDHGFKISGIEVDKNSLRFAKKQGFEIYDSLKEVSDENFEMIIAFDLLEHIDRKEINYFLQEISRVLKKGGLLIARFPNGDSAFSLVLQNGHQSHLTHIGKGFIDSSSKQAGLTLIEYRNPAVVIKQRNIILTFLKLVKLMFRTAIEKIYSFIFFSDFKHPSSANALAVVVKLKK